MGFLATRQLYFSSERGDCSSSNAAGCPMKNAFYESAFIPCYHSCACSLISCSVKAGLLMMVAPIASRTFWNRSLLIVQISRKTSRHFNINHCNFRRTPRRKLSCEGQQEDALIANQDSNNLWAGVGTGSKHNPKWMHHRHCAVHSRQKLADCCLKKAGEVVSDRSTLAMLLEKAARFY